MADKSHALVLEALERIMAEPGGLPLFGGKTQPGLFAGSAAGKRAAQVCQSEGLLKNIRTEPRGKSTVDICAISEKGLAFLLDQVNPRPILEAFVRSLDARQGQFADLLADARVSQRYLEELKETVQKVLERVAGGGGRVAGTNGDAYLVPHSTVESAVLDRLRHWQGAGTDCPLPEVYRSIQSVCPGCTIGQYHDCLRQLLKEARIYLHPWTGPLYEMPEPHLALLAGHEVAYYASQRMKDEG